MNILVTGGAGFVGSACLRFLLENGHHPIAYDNLVQGHESSVPKDRLIRNTILDTEHLIQTMNSYNIDAVMHFAAATYVAESVERPDYHYDNNIGGTLSILNAMKASNIKQLLFSSTCATYGDSPTCPMSETSPQIPCSPYARTKLAVEWMIKDFADAYDIGFTILRYFNAAGGEPDGTHGEAHDPENHLIPIVLQVPNGIRDQVMVYGNDYPTPDGTCIRDYIHIRDLASAHELAIKATSNSTKAIYNLGTGHGHSVMEIIKTCESVTGQKIPYQITNRRPGDAPELVADPSKIKSELGWIPQFDHIQDIVASAWKWHQTHPKGYGTN